VLLILKILVEVLEGLESLHETVGLTGQPLHLVHRGVTWNNVQLSYDGRVKLVDFGCASSSDYRVPHSPSEEDMRFCAPEVVQTGLGDHRADLYSFGVMLWELCSGAKRYVSQPLSTPRLDSPLPWLPPAIEGICAHALASDPSQRYQSALRLRSDLATLLGEMGETDLDCTDTLTRVLATHFAKEKAHLEEQIAMALATPHTDSIASSASLISSATYGTAPSTQPSAPPTNPSGPPISSSPPPFLSSLPSDSVGPFGPFGSVDFPPTQGDDDTAKSFNVPVSAQAGRSRLIRGAIIALVAFSAFALWFKESGSKDKRDDEQEPHSKTAIPLVPSHPAAPVEPTVVDSPQVEVIALDDLDDDSTEPAPDEEKAAPAAPPRPRIYPRPKPAGQVVAQKKTTKSAPQAAPAPQQDLKISRSISWE
jgi:serine/threonine protein kinase